MGLGSLTRVSLAKARDKAGEARALLADGIDPIAQRGSAVVPPTFGDLSETLILSMESQWRNAKHRDQWRSSLQTHASRLFPLRVDRITTEDILAVLKPIWVDKAETASRVRNRIERVLDAAIAQGYKADANPARWKGHLKSLLPPRAKLSRGHHAALSYTALPEFQCALRKRAGISARALEFLILTATRSGEVRQATRDEFDLDAAVWTIPAGRMKAGREHRIPLSARAVELVRACEPLSELSADKIAFPGLRGRPLSDASLSKVLRSMELPKEVATVHGFRSSFRDWAGEESDHQREIIEAALAHVVGDQTERAYRRKDALEKRRVLMDDWSDFLDDVDKKANKDDKAKAKK